MKLGIIKLPVWLNENSKDTLHIRRSQVESVLNAGKDRCIVQMFSGAVHNVAMGVERVMYHLNWD